MGKKGAPKGNSNASKGREWTNAVTWALENYTSSKIERAQALRAIATKMVEQAIEGDKDARREIGDRLEGKAVDRREITGTIAHEYEGLQRASEILGEFVGSGQDDSDPRTLPH